MRQGNGLLMFLGIVALGGAVKCLAARSFMPFAEWMDESVERKIGIGIEWLVIGGVIAGGLYLIASVFSRRQ
jgi:hypothetical protein